MAVELGDDDGGTCGSLIEGGVLSTRAMWLLGGARLPGKVPLR